MRELEVSKQELGINSFQRVATSSSLIATSYFLVPTSWVQHVYSRWGRSGHNPGLSPEAEPVASAAEHKPRGLRTAKPPLTQPVVTSLLDQFAAVSQPVMPIIHTTNKNNNKVNYLKNYLLLIRSPV